MPAISSSAHSLPTPQPPPPLFVDRKTDVQGWGLCGATRTSDQRMSVLTKRFLHLVTGKSSATNHPRYRCPSKLQDAGPHGQESTLPRQHSTQPEMTPADRDPRATSLNLAPEVHAAPRAGLSTSEGGHSPHQGRLPATNCPFQNRVP